MATKATKKSVATKEIKEVKSSWFVRIFKGIGGYFKGAWQELREVRWPNRKATWSLTSAVLLFTLFFVIIILLLDSLFKWIFQLILQ